jgi:hypothetical protein
VLCESKDSSETARSALIVGRVLVLAVFLCELVFFRVRNRAFFPKEFELGHCYVVSYLSFHQTVEVHLVTDDAEAQRTQQSAQRR